MRTRYNSNLFSWFKKSTALAVVFSLLISTLLTPIAYSKNIPTNHKLRSASKFLNIGNQHEYTGTSQAELERNIRTVSEQLNESDQKLNVIFLWDEKKANLKPLNLLQGAHEWVKGRKQEWRRDWKKWWLWNFLYYATSPISGAPNTETPLLLGLVLGANHFLIFVLLSDPLGRVLAQGALLLALSGILALLHGDLFSNKQILNESPSFTGALKKLSQPFWQRTIGEIFLIAPIQFLPFHIGFAISWTIHFIWNFGVGMGWWNLAYLSFTNGSNKFLERHEAEAAPETFNYLLNSLGELKADQTIAVGKRSSAIPLTLNDEGVLFFKELFSLENAPKDCYLLSYRTKSMEQEIPYGIIVMSDNPYFLNLTEYPLFQGLDINFNATAQANAAADVLFPGDFTPIGTYSEVSIKTIKADPYLNHSAKAPRNLGDPFTMLVLNRDRVFLPTDKESKSYQRVLYNRRELFKNKSVLEIGVGTGVGLLVALRLGANSVSGTDISAVHVMLTRWNLQYAQETKQIKPIEQRKVNVVIGNGFVSLPLHDLYLWNTPGISSKKEVDKYLSAHKETMRNSLGIYSDQFISILTELKERLMQPNAKAIWRIILNKDNGLVDEKPIQVSMLEPELEREAKVIEQFRDRAVRFLEKYGLNGKLVSDDSANDNSNIYFIEGIESHPLTARTSNDRMISRAEAVAEIREAIAKARPDIIDRYDRLYAIQDDEDSVRALREELYKITSGDFINWELSHILDPVLVPSFKGDFRKALAAVFDDPRLNFSIPEMKRFGITHQLNTRKSKRGRRVRPAGLASQLVTKLSELLEQYRHFNSLDEDGRIKLRGALASHLNIVDVPAQLEKALIIRREISEEIERVWKELDLVKRKTLARRPMKIVDHMNLGILSDKADTPLPKRYARPIMKYAMEFYGADLLKQLNHDSVEFRSEHPADDLREEDDKGEGEFFPLAKEEALARGLIKGAQPIDDSLRETQITVILEAELKKRFSKAKLNRGALMGFVRDEQGKIQPVFSKSSMFESVRDIDPETVSPFGGWDGDREMQRVPLKLAEVEIKEMNTSFEWASLPSWLRDIFSAGKIFYTSSKIESPYSVLMAVGEDHMSGRATGRSGVLLKDGLPVVLEIRGKEFVVEIKGVGAPEGGFDYKDSYLRGGAVVEESDLEYENLEAMRSRTRFQNGFMPRALANAHFINQNHEVQGYLMRLSPGNVRASFKNNNAYDFMDKNEKVKKIAYEMGREIGEHLAEGFVPLSHVENLIVLNREFDCAFTDYYDVRPLHHFPFEYNHSTLDLENAVRSSLYSLYEIEGFRENNGFEYAIKGLGNSLLKSGKISEEEKNHLLALKDHAEVALYLWAKFIASDYYLAIRKHGLSSRSKTYKMDYASLRQMTQTAKERYAENKEEIRIKLEGGVGNWEQRILKLERCNRLLEKSGFTPQGMVALMQSEDFKREFFKIISSLEMTDLTNSDYYSLLLAWYDYTFDLLAAASKLKKQIEYLRIVFESAPSEFKNEVRLNMEIAQGNLTQLQPMTPYDYYLEIQKNRDFSKQVLKLPYHSKVKTKIDRTKKKKEQRDFGGIIFAIKDFVLRLFPKLSPTFYDLGIAPWLENLISYGLTYGLVYLITGGDIHLASTISANWGWGTFMILHLFNFIGKDSERSPPVPNHKESKDNLPQASPLVSMPKYVNALSEIQALHRLVPHKEAVTNLILSIFIASINLYFGFSPSDPQSFLIHFTVNTLTFLSESIVFKIKGLRVFRTAYSKRFEEKLNAKKPYFPLQNLFKEAVSKVLKRADFKPRNLIRVLKRDPMLAKLYKAKTGVSEGYTLEQHTAMVLKQFEKYFGGIELPAGIDKRTFKLMLALHDIGKPIAFKKDRMGDQHLHTREIIEKIAHKLPLSEQEIALMLVLFEGDPIGMYLQKLISLEEAAEKIRTMANNTILSINQFFNLLTIYYQSDAASYTRDAGGKKGLENLFVRYGWQSSRFQFDRDQKRLYFSSSVETMFRELEMEVKKYPIFLSKDVKPKTAEEIKSKLFAVHATSIFPKGGILRAEAKESRGLADWESDDQPFFRPTLHFALGGLVRAAHELQPYAVVCPLKDLETQLINISANDTFILGDFHLTADSYLLAPEGTDISFLDSNVKVRNYDPAEGLRRAVEQLISEQGGWMVKMYPGGIDVGSIAETEESEINSLQFFQDLVDSLPYLSVGNHARSEHGQAFRFGVIEFALQHLMLNYFGVKESQSKSTTNIKFLRSLILYHLPKLELWIRSLPLPQESIDLFDLKKEQLLRWLKIVDDDLVVRQKFKRTIRGSARWIQKVILKTKENPKIVHVLIKGLASILLLPKVKFSYGSSPTYLAQWLSPMPPDELKELIRINQELFKETDLRQLYVNYAIIRWLIIRASRAKEEGLDKILSDSFEQLEENPPFQLEHLLQGLEDYLTPSSNRVEDALELIRQPAVQRFLFKAYGIKFDEGCPKTLEEAGVLFTAMRRTKDFTHASSASALDSDHDKQIKSGDSLQRLYEIWLKGKDSRDELICEARKLGFDGLIIENDIEKPLNGNQKAQYDSPLSRKYVNTYSIYQTGIKENNQQHTTGNGVYFWRETLEGYEYLYFDWGLGVINARSKPVRNIGRIFSVKSYRKGKPFNGLNRLKSGDGNGFRALAKASSLARIVSVNNGEIHIANKRAAGELGTILPAIQKQFRLPAEHKNVTGFAAHGFAPFSITDYQGGFSFISEGNILGSVETKKSKQIVLGKWQMMPAQGLEALKPGDHVTFIYYHSSLRAGDVLDHRMDHRGILQSVPSGTNQGVFIFDDGFTIGYEKVKEFIKHESQSIEGTELRQEISLSHEGALKQQKFMRLETAMDRVRENDSFNVMARLVQKNFGGSADEIFNSRILNIDLALDAPETQSMPFAENEFDTAYSARLLHWGMNSKDQPAFYRGAAKEVRRVLKPEGRFLTALGFNSIVPNENLDFLNAFKEAGFEITELGNDIGYYLMTNKKSSSDAASNLGFELEDSQRSDPPTASILGLKWAEIGIAGKLEQGFFAPISNVFAKAIMKQIGSDLVRKGLADHSLLDDLKKMEPTDKTSLILAGVGSLAILTWLTASMISGVWWSEWGWALGIWSVTTGIAFQRAHQDREIDKFIIGAILAGAMVTPAILFLFLVFSYAVLFPSWTLFVGYSGAMVIGGILGRNLNITLHNFYNQHIESIQKIISWFKSLLPADISRHIPIPSAASILDSDDDHSLKSDDSLQELYKIWLEGRDSRDKLICEARKLGFDGVIVKNYEEYSIDGKKDERGEPFGLPKGINSKMRQIYYSGIRDNNFQHADGNFVFFWRITENGCEYCSFDWGPGVMNPQENPVEDIGQIFDEKSYREGKLYPIRKDHFSYGAVGGGGIGFMFLGRSSFLARVVSVNGGSVKVLTKAPGGGYFRKFEKPVDGSAFEKHVETTQVTYALPPEHQSASGFAVHGFVPLFTENYEGKFSPPLENNILGAIQSAGVQKNKRDSWENESQSAYELKLDKYFEENNFAQYPELKKSFTPEVLEALLDDRSLRPVFMVVLEENKGQVGSLNIVNRKALDKIGGEALLNSHSAFLAGMAGFADAPERMAKEGFKIIVGVTDDVMKPEDLPKNRDEIYRSRTWNVANGRTAYFPLKDGTWLAVKGSGQNRTLGRRPYFLNGGILSASYYDGIVTQEEARRAIEGYHLLKETNGFIQMLGHRQIFQLPNGSGDFNNADQLDDSNGDPVDPFLVFYRVLTPHRLIKFSQLLNRDPNLLGLRKRISRALFSMGLISKGTVLSEEELIYRIAKELGRTEAIKQNSGLFKESIHWQDFTFAGEEADLEELLTLEQYTEHLKQTPNHNEDEELLKEYGLGIEGIMEKIMTLILMINSLDQEKKLFFPDGVKPLKIMMQEYFKNLEDEYIKAWMVEKWGELPRALVHIKNLSFEVFYPETADKANYRSLRNHRSLRKEVVLLIYGWLKEEAGKRGIQTESQSNSSDIVDQSNGGNVAKENNGGVMEWLKEQTIKFLLPIFPHKYRKILFQNYDIAIAPWWENLISFAVSSLFFGLPVFIFTGDIARALKVSYLGSWPILVLGHTPLAAKFFNSRAPSSNFRDSVLIALVNIALPFLPFQFPFLIFSFSTIVFLSFATHFIMNLARAMIPNIGLYLKMAFEKNNGLIINAFDVGDYSDLELAALAKQIEIAYKTETKIIVPLFTNKDKIDIFKLRRELIHQYNLTDAMLGNVCFGGVVVTRKDLLLFQAMDPVKGIEAEALYSALKAKLLELKRLDSELFVQVFTSNEGLFRIRPNLEKKIRILLILSSSKVQPLTPIFDQDSLSRKLVETNQ
ncbi:MAG: methyltransferase domain-containing protein [Elusimicrobia bacterium]|nr:methyltransferase domain-containing protein [Elusimicrobiota bacterium]